VILTTAATLETLVIAGGFITPSPSIQSVRMTIPDRSLSDKPLENVTSRRKFLSIAGAAGIASIAGCSGGDGSDGDGSDGDGSDGGSDGSDGGSDGSDGDGGSDGSDGGGSDGSDGDGSDGTATDGSPSDLGSVTVASVNPMTGAYSSLGPGQRKGAELAVKQINGSDEYSLELDAVYEDTGTETGTAQQSAQRVVQQDGAEYIFGAISSSVALSLNEFAASEEIIYFPGGAAVPITGSACNEWVFRFETNTAQVAEAISAYTVNNLGSNVWFHIADYAYGDSVYQRTKERMQAANDSFTEAGKTASELGSSNYGSYISQISNSDAEAVILGMTGGDLINFVSQAADAGLKEEVALVGPTQSFQVVRGALGSKAVGTYGGVRYNANIELGDNQEFVSAYQSEYDGLPDNFERVGYDSIRSIARGMQEAGSTAPADVRDALAGGTFETVLGDVTYRECDHQATNPTWMCELVEGEGDISAVELLSKTEGEDALPACGELGCDLG
jgi:branched-chain amino acid transport system substrate-binding protein